MIKPVTFPRWFRFDAITLYPFIFVRAGMENDEALIAHEQVHLQDQKNWFVLPWFLLYFLSPRFRFTAEVLGHAAQVRANGCSVQWAAAHITNRYWTFCTFAEAEASLLQTLSNN
jgi:hypothetical protein